jgi:hypothetical protein
MNEAYVLVRHHRLNFEMAVRGNKRHQHGLEPTFVSPGAIWCIRALALSRFHRQRPSERGAWTPLRATLKRRATSAADFWPEPIISTASRRWPAFNFGLRPPTPPMRRADASPLLVRSRIMARSNSAKAPSICTIMRPAGKETLTEWLRDHAVADSREIAELTGVLEQRCRDLKIEPPGVETDLRALTPLIWEHVNPYGRFELDMTTRLPIG